MRWRIAIATTQDLLTSIGVHKSPHSEHSQPVRSPSRGWPTPAVGDQLQHVCKLTSTSWYTHIYMLTIPAHNFQEVEIASLDTSVNSICAPIQISHTESVPKYSIHIHRVTLCCTHWSPFRDGPCKCLGNNLAMLDILDGLPAPLRSRSSVAR